jgi:hypothetical protein
VGCRHKLDFLLLHNFTAPMTHPVGISNDVMAAVPGDAYLAHILPRLSHWNRWMGIKYIQVRWLGDPSGSGPHCFAICCCSLHHPLLHH